MSRSSALTGVTGLLVLAAAAAAAPGDLKLPASILFPIGQISDPRNILASDLDGDAQADLVISGKPILMWRNAGRGTLTPLPSIDLDGIAQVVDLDGDGDVSVVSLSLAGVHARESVGPFLFGPVETLAGDSFKPAWCEHGDFNGDGAVDLVGSLKMWLNDGSGGLLPSFSAAPGIFLSVSFADVDNDGDLDAAGYSVPPTFGALLLGAGDGTFTVEPPLTLAGTPLAMLLCNINDDGLTDLVASSAGITEVLAGTGGGGFTRIASGETSATGFPVCDVADADGDGDLDVLARAAGSDAVAVHRIEGGSLVALPGIQPFSYFGQPKTRFADFDGDGRSGIVMVSGGGSNDMGAVSVPGDGTGDLSVRKLLTPDDSFSPPLVVDVDGDGRPEVVALRVIDVANQEIQCWDVPGNGTLVELGAPTPVPLNKGVLLPLRLDADTREDLVVAENELARPFRSNGDGTFTPEPVLPFDFGSKVFAGDVDDDGDDDLILIHQVNPPVWYPSLGDGTFGVSSPLVLPAFTQENTVAMAIGDADGDGLRDLFLGLNKSSPASLRYYRGLGQGVYASPIDLGAPTSSCERTVLLRDIDGDSDLDVVGYGGLFDASVTVVRGDGAGGFDPPINFKAASHALQLTLADLNGDGLEDVVVTDYFELDGRQAFALQLADGQFTSPRNALLGTTALDIDRDGDDDLLCPGNGDGTEGISCFISTPDSSFIDAGGASSGSVGLPLLQGSGLLVPGAAVHLVLRAAAPDALAQLVIGHSSQLLPPAGGGAPSQFVINGLSTDSAGRLVVAGHWPPGVPEGLGVYVQIWISDPDVPGGVSSSNIVQLLGSE